MKNNSRMHKPFHLLSSFLLATMLLLGSCDNDPEPEEEEELITTLTVTLVPRISGDPITLRFYDADGAGAIEPIYTVSGPFMANTVYDAALAVFNDSENPPVNVTEEIAEESEDHLFCFTPAGVDIVISEFDRDANNMNVGITSQWAIGAAGSGTVQIVLRHQPGTKTGECPGTGSSDIDVTFDIVVE